MKRKETEMEVLLCKTHKKIHKQMVMTEMKV